MTAADLLVEVGTEELPPKALAGLIAAFAENLSDELAGSRLAFDGLTTYASPRRLAAVVAGLALAQDDREVDMKGPPVRIAFDDDGKPQPAALAFARKCGVDVTELGRSSTDKGEWLTYRKVESGVAAAAVLPALIERVLRGLPVPRPMRWGDSDTEFVRPIHWVVLVHGDAVVPGTVLGVTTGAATRGHRFMSPGSLTIERPADYPSILEKGFVLADVAERRRRIEQGVADAAAECGGRAVTSDALLDEVTALVEWPVAITGRFDDRFLELPREVIVATLTSHQRYFPIEDDGGRLLPSFVTIANLVSRDPDRVRDGNERVIRPRLADAAFFWDTDRRTPLAERQEALDGVVYQKGLGSIGDRSSRIADLAARIAGSLDVAEAPVRRAAMLAKCDLLTGMVGEFPELQGVMGRYYAQADGEADEVATAIAEHYLPRFAGDAIPAGGVGRSVAIAEKLDAICGAFAIGKKPSGNRDPFGLRRSALGIVRIVVEGRLELNLNDLIGAAVAAQSVDAADDVESLVYAYVIDRMRAYCLEREELSVEMFEAVRARAPASLLDFDLRLDAVAAFVGLDAADALAAADKRIANILRQAGYRERAALDTELLAEAAERALHEALEDARSAVTPLFEARSYAEALSRLAALRGPVDTFFDDVMVMVDDEKLKTNRLTLLAELRDLFLNVADISRLSIG